MGCGAASQRKYAAPAESQPVGLVAKADEAADDDGEEAKPVAVFSAHDGCISRGGDIHREVMGRKDAELKCTTLPGCRGFCHKGPPTEDAVEMIFKDKWESAVVKNEWTSYKWVNWRINKAEWKPVVHTVAPAILSELLDTALLGQFQEAALQHCKDEAIVDLGMLYERENMFSDALDLKPLQRKRLRKALGRSGDSVPLLPLDAEGPERQDSPDADESAPVEKPFPIAGLKEVLCEAQLPELCASARYWCEETGAVGLDEVCENAAHFARFLMLSPDERDRVYLGLNITPPARKQRKKKDANNFVSNLSVLSMKSAKSTTSTNSAECLIEVFKLLDKQSSGLVKPHTLRTWLVDLGMDLSDEETQDMLEFCPPDENGFINYVDFVHAVLAPKT